MEPKQIELRQVRDFGAIIGITFEFIRQNFMLLFKSSLYIAGPFIFLAGIFLGLYQSAILNLRNVRTMNSIGWPFFLYVLFAMVAALMLYSIVYNFVLLYEERGFGNFDINDIWEKVKSNFWMIFFTGIGYAFFVLLGSVFLIIPGVYLAVTLSLIFIIRLREGLSFFAAFDRCTKLISQNWWFTFGLILVVGLIQGFIGFIFYLPSYIAMVAMVFSGMNNPNQQSSGNIIFIITSVIASLSFLLYTISVIAVSFHYFNLVERKEAPSLIAKIDSIE